MQKTKEAGGGQSEEEPYTLSPEPYRVLGAHVLWDEVEEVEEGKWHRKVTMRASKEVAQGQKPWRLTV